MTGTSIDRWVWCGLLLPVLVGAGGCSPRSGTVEGYVAVDGRPVNHGTVILSGGDNRSDGGTIGADGHYVARNVPVGEVKVVVFQLHLTKDIPDHSYRLYGKERPAAVVARPVRVPAKYQNVETSGLTHVVTSGTTTFNVELSSK